MKISIVREALLVAALAFVPAIGQAIYFRERVSWNEQRFGDEVTVAQTQAWGDSVMWVDARPDEEFEREHVPNAVVLNEDRWNELLPQMLAVWSPEKRVVIYCSTQSCGASRSIAKRLREEAQLTNVYVLEGGWDAWLKSKR
jgi:rhodanese-related sulfurtransferase